MNDIELQETSVSITSINATRFITSILLSGLVIDVNGTLTCSATVSGDNTGVDIHGLDVYVDDSFTYMWTTDYDKGCLFKYYPNNSSVDIGIANAKYTSERVGKDISVQVKSNYEGAASGTYKVVSSSVNTIHVPTSEDLGKQFIAFEEYEKRSNKYRFGILPPSGDYSKSYTRHGIIYYTIDGSDPSDENNTNRIVYEPYVRILVPNESGTYRIRAYQKVGTASAEIQEYTYTINTKVYNTPTISFDNNTNSIIFSNFPTNVSDNIILLLQYEIYYDDGTDESKDLNIGDNTSLQTIVSKSGKVRCRIVDSNGVIYGYSSWSDYTYFVTFIRYDLPSISIDSDTYLISFSNIPTDTYLYINIYYNDDTEEIKQKIEGDNDGKYSFTYTKGGKLKYYVVDKSGYDIGHSDWSDYINFTIKGETLPEVYNTPTLSVGSDNNVVISNIQSGYKVEYTVIYDYDDDGVPETSRDYSSTDYENSINVSIGKYLGKIRARLVNLNGDSVGASKWSDYLDFDFTDKTPDPEPEITITIPNINTEEVTVDNVTKIKVVFTRDSSETYLYTKVYYTIDSSIPDINSNLATIGKEFYIVPSTNNFYIKYKAYYEIDDKTYWSKTGYINVNISDTPDPNPKPDPEPGDNTDDPFYNGYTKPTLKNKVVKNYIDIIYSINPEDTKSLESIQYVLDEIIQPFGTINLAEQLFARKYNNTSKSRFSGNKLVLYSDETYSGELNINVGTNINKMNEYKLPTFQKGHWEFNYFRNELANKFTKEELQKVYTNIPITNANGETSIVTITVEDLINSISTTNKNNIDIFRSDNRSLIYGKYIVARFIFNNDKRVKLQNVTFITNNY